MTLSQQDEVVTVNMVGHMYKWWAIYTNLPVSDIVRLPDPRSGNSQGQETFLAPSTRNYDTECSNII